MFKLITSILLCVISIQIHAQSLNGAWYGRADVVAQGNHSNYLTELILRQKGNNIEGVFGYYFKDTYQSFYVRGTYNPQTREVFIDNLPILFYQSTGRNGIECPMSFSGKLIVSQVGRNITGSFYSDEKYKYTCPELTVNFNVDQEIVDQDELMKSTLVGKKIWTPAEEDYIVSIPASRTSAPVVQKIPNSFERKEFGDITPSTLNFDAQKLLIKSFESRKKNIVQDVDIMSDSIRVSFYDNGEIDGDSISVFLNGQPVLVNEGLSARAITLYLALDPTKEYNEISMFAENLGLYPPNTAIMIISDGINTFEVFLSSSLNLNSTVRIRRKKSQ